MEEKQTISKNELYRRMLEHKEKEAGMPIGICIDDSFSMWKYQKQIKAELERLLERIRGNTLYEESVYLSFRIVNRETRSIPFQAAKAVSGCPELHPRGIAEMENLLETGLDMMDQFDPDKLRAEAVLVLITDGHDNECSDDFIEDMKEWMENNEYRLILALPDVRALAESQLFKKLELEEADIAYYGGGSARSLERTLFECIKRNSESMEMAEDWLEDDDDEEDSLDEFVDQQRSGFTEEVDD